MQSFIKAELMESMKAELTAKDSELAEMKKKKSLDKASIEKAFRG